MIAPFLRKLALVFSIVVTTVSCGGDGGSDVAGGGIGGTGISSGTITGFGSIFVNGVEFDTSGAAITIDGNPASENDLKKGIVVTVQGTISGTSGTTTRVAAEDVVKGLVQSVAADGLSMVVLGQTVLVDNTTIIDNSIPGQDIRNLTLNVDLVEVHGFVKGKGLIGASFIERKGALAEFRVKGFVENTDTSAQTFTIGALTIDYSGLPGGNPVNGQLVNVKGQNAPGPSGALLATKVEPEGLGVSNASQAEVEGFVTSMTSTSDFVVNSQRVVTTGATIFAGGLQSEIVVGLKVEVEGMLTGGVLTCTRVSFRDSIKLESDVATGSIGADSFMLDGLPGITVQVNGQTEYKGNATTFADIGDGDHVRIRGRVAAGNTVIASEVDERSPDTRVVLQGPVDAMPAPIDPIVSILGQVVDVDINGFQDPNDYKGLDGLPIGRAAFFVAIQPTDLVKAQGDLAGSTVIWDEIELED